MTTTAESVRGLLESTGHQVQPDPADPGVLRAYFPISVDPKFAAFMLAKYGKWLTHALVGMVIVRDGFIVYAEHGGKIVPFAGRARTMRQYRRRVGEWRKLVRASNP